ncbi:gluconokinase [Planctobacterium marinum]|uniref:Gluconokinase n=1 Tax=Planctobacterium marinum TaxID=1631968 RepID=A0AA48KNV5_9ALTE|nr:gluconokinase [Planctobacterium marinum]
MKRLYVVMGVSGCGKSTLGQLLAQRLTAPFLDADDYHSEAAKALMRKGIGLNDVMRAPWFDRLEQAIKSQPESSIVLACSALSKNHRQRIRAMASEVRFLLLEVAPDLLSSRLENRQQHFANTSLLKSQLSTFEYPENENDVLPFDGAGESAILIEHVIDTLERHNVCC